MIFVSVQEAKLSKVRHAREDGRRPFDESGTR
jgi:hypothetical protein